MRAEVWNSDILPYLLAIGYDLLLLSCLPLQERLLRAHTLQARRQGNQSPLHW